MNRCWNNCRCEPARMMKFNAIINGWFRAGLCVKQPDQGDGLADIYPFVLPARGIEKLRFVHDTIRGAEVAEPATV